MSLSSLLSKSLSVNIEQQEMEVTIERVEAQMDTIREKIAFFRAYPDLFIDFIKGPDCTFNFFFYQRIVLRIFSRYKYVYATFPRAFSKSFLAVMTLMIRAILYPNSHLAVSTGGKEQAASITLAKLEELCRLIPALKDEINWSRGATKNSKNDVEYIFKNGSKIDILAAKQSSRGQRRTGLLIEEAILMDGDILHEVIVPTTNIDRLLPDGTYDPKETPNKSQIYITTAGYKNMFAYAKLIELLVQSVLDPTQVMILGGSYKTPVIEGLLSEDFVDQLRLSDTFDENSFAREYGSVWGGDAGSSFFSSEVFDKNRVLLQPEYSHSDRSSKTAYYVLGVDIGRSNCTTEVSVIKVTPQTQGAALKSCVNFVSIGAMDFEQQAIKLKLLYYQYKAKILAIDGNGVGFGLLDFMTKTQIEPHTGDTLPPFGMEGATKEVALEPYKNIKGPGVEENAIFIIKAQAQENTEAHSYVQAQMANNRVKFLIDEKQAKIKLMETKKGQAMDPDQRTEYLRPFVLTTGLREQLANLKEENEGANVILKQVTKKIPKDRFSSFEYGMLYIKRYEEQRSRHKKFNIADFMFMN